VSGVRLVVGLIVMGILLPVAIFFLLDLTTVSQLLTVAASTFLSWGSADLLSSLLERPRKRRNESPVQAIGEEWQRSKD
jgi:hypothetical protein